MPRKCWFPIAAIGITILWVLYVFSAVVRWDIQDGQWEADSKPGVYEVHMPAGDVSVESRRIYAEHCRITRVTCDGKVTTWLKYDNATPVRID